MGFDNAEEKKHFKKYFYCDSYLWAISHSKRILTLKEKPGEIAENTQVFSTLI